jgi:uncharacterized protein DUF4326
VKKPRRKKTPETDIAARIRTYAAGYAEGNMKRLVVHFQREPYDVYIGRPSIWGNPFKVGVMFSGAYSRADAIRLYKDWLLSRPDLVQRAKRELRGKVLGCWCAPLPCHGDVLAHVANEGT